MTSKQLIDALRGTGTGESKLAAAEATGIADAHDLIDAMAIDGKWSVDTLAKAKKIAGERPVKPEPEDAIADNEGESTSDNE